MPDQYSLEDFGKRIKAKYPQYQGMSDTDIASKVLAKYPQYRSAIKPTSSQPESVPSGIPNWMQQAGHQVAEAGRGAAAGIGGILSSFAHPIQSAAAMGEQAMVGSTPYGTPLIAPTGNQARDIENQRQYTATQQRVAGQEAQQMRNRPVYTIASILGPMALGAGAERVGESVPGAARGIARSLTGTGESATGKFIADVAEKNKAEQLRAAGVKGKTQEELNANAARMNQEAAQKHLEQTQAALHETRGRELTHQQKITAANDAAREANQALDREHESAVQEALDKTRQTEDLHNQELANARLKGEDAYQKKLKEVEEARTKAEQDRRKELREYMKKKSDIIAENQKVQGAQSRKTAAAHGVKRIDETLRGDLTSTREKVKAEADSRYANQRTELNKKQIPWNPADAENPNAITNENIIGKITDAWDTSITGSEGRPPVIKSIAERINRNEPMTWRDLQGYRSEISKKLSSGTLPGDEYHAYTKALNIIDDGMQKIADANGMGRQVASDRAFYRQYMETFMDPSSPVYKAMHASERGGTINALMNMDRSGIETVARYNPELAKRLNAGRNALEVAKAPAGGTLKSLPKLGERPAPIESPERPGEPQVAAPVRAEIPNRPSPVQPNLPAPVERVEVPNRPRAILPKVAEETPEMRANLTKITPESISQQKANAMFRAAEPTQYGKNSEIGCGNGSFLST